MPIPEVNENGFFPLGEHETNTYEIFDMYVNNEARIEMWDSFHDFMHYITEMNCFHEMILFGSYFSDKPDPGDIDVALRFKLADHSANVDPLIFNKEHNKDRFNIDVCIIEPVNPIYIQVAPAGYKFNTRNLHFATILTKEEAMEIGRRTKEFPYGYLANPVKGVLKIVLD